MLIDMSSNVAQTQKIVIVDDNESFAEYLCDALHLLNYSARPFLDPFDFIEADDYSDSTLLLDLQMPKIDGIELLRRISSFKSPPKAIILMSGTGEQILKPAQLLARQLNLNIAGYIAKPFTLSNLQKILTQAARSVETSHIQVDFDRPFLRSDLIDAVNAGDIEVHFQPIYSCKPNDLVGFESLAGGNIRNMA